MKLEFTITGAPRTKKNSRQHVLRRGRTIPIPSKAWVRWAAEALIELPEMKPAALVRFTAAQTVRAPVNCKALFYLDADRGGDACGYYQGLADLLEKRGVVENDRLIVSWDGSRLLLDRKNPRTEVVLEKLTEAGIGR